MRSSFEVCHHTRIRVNDKHQNILFNFFVFLKHHRKKMEGRRLDFDCKKRKGSKSKTWLEFKLSLLAWMIYRGWIIRLDELGQSFLANIEANIDASIKTALLQFGDQKLSFLVGAVLLLFVLWYMKMFLFCFFEVPPEEIRAAEDKFDSSKTVAYNAMLTLTEGEVSLHVQLCIINRNIKGSVYCQYG